MLSIDTLSQWYFCVSLGKKLWMVPEQRKVSKLKLINKGHIPKIMVIAAVGTPVTGAGHSLEDKSNGKVGIWRVMQNKKRSKSGWGPGRKKYYHAGDHQEVDCTLKGRGFQKTFIDKVGPFCDSGCVTLLCVCRFIQKSRKNMQATKK